jgi:hypothetical protein
MRIGVDFDNTIVCYDEAVAILADKLFKLDPKVARTKIGLRNYFREKNAEYKWTEFQGELYGPGMIYARPYEGSVEALQKLKEDGHDLVLISHRSRKPYAGRSHDLHGAARLWVCNWLQNKGLFGDIGGSECVHFLETQKQKLEMITHQRCDAFIDDLPEVLFNNGFPAESRKYLFDPTGNSRCHNIRYEVTVISKWIEIPQSLKGL